MEASCDSVAAVDPSAWVAVSCVYVACSFSLMLIPSNGCRSGYAPSLLFFSIINGIQSS